MNGLEKLSEPELRMTMAYCMLRELALRYIILILLAALGFQRAYAQTTDQNYPVTAQAFIAAQPNARLSTYFSSNTALMVNLLLKDLTKSSIQVYLKWSLDGPGVRVASPDGYIPAGLITLDRGVITRFSGAQLQNDYFLAGAIEEQGLNGNPLRTSLPEGFYTFRVQALEAGTGREVSNIGETYFSITTPLPPIINIPFNGAELRMSQPQRVDIQWIPRHYRFPGNVTSYDLKVCKVPDGYEPTEALDACVTPVIDDKGNPGTFYPGNTGIGNSIIGALEQGVRYAARVTVHEIDVDGNEVIFANEGRSEVTWFRYGKPCTSPEAFTINESGPGRVQLSWAAQTGVDGYNVLYRKEGELNWTSQKVTAASATVAGLDQGKYEFGILSVSLSGGCPVGDPENAQLYTLTGDDQNGESLPIALTDPMNLPVQASGCQAVTPGALPDYYANFPRMDIPGAAANDTAGKLKIPGCALQSSAFTVCSPEHPNVILPTGVQLGSLAAGDVLGIYDFAVFVTQASGTGTFTGRGLVRLPFMEGALALAEFSGLKAIRSEDGSGGCVYEVGEFRLLNTSQAETAAAKAQLITALARRTDPAAYSGTLADALARYDAAPNAAAACSYQAAVLQASARIREALQELLAGTPGADAPAVSDLIALLDALTGSLQAGNKVDSLTNKYEELVAQIDSLKQEIQQPGAGAPGGGSTDPVYVIRNVRVDNITYQGAAISWEGPSGIDKYIIQYIDKDGAVLQETVPSVATPGTQLNLARLREGMQYSYQITAYKDGKAVASYGQDVFSTIKRIVPNPENLQYTAGLTSPKAVTVTWNTNPAHKSYRLIYTDQDGIERTVYPTTNQTQLTGLARDRSYSYRVMAYGENGLVSEEVPGIFKLGTVCDVRINTSGLHVIQGTKVTLNMASCVNEAGQQGMVMWEDGQTQFRQSTIEVTPQVTTTYKVYCQLERILDNGDREAVSCEDSVTVQVENKCEGVLATVSTTSVVQGGPLMLRSSGCDEQPQWKDGISSGNLLGTQSNILIYPIQTQNYVLSCTKDGSTCRVATETVTVVPSCEGFKLAASSQGAQLKENRIITVKAAGCPGEIAWSIDGKAKDAKASFPDKNTVVYSNVSSGFAVAAKCKETGCAAKTEKIEEPSGQACILRVALLEETDQNITLAVQDAITGFKWDDTGLSDNPRTLPKPTQSQVFSVSSVYSNNSRYCVGAYPYQPKTGGSDPIVIPCVDFKVSVPSKVVVYRDGSTKNIAVSAAGCSDGVAPGKVAWYRNGKSLGFGTGTNYSATVPFSKADVGFPVKVAAICDKTGQQIVVDVIVRLETVEEEACRKKVTNFYAWVEPPMSMQGAFFEPKYGANAKVYVVGCKGSIFWESLPLKDRSIVSGTQSSQSESETWFGVPVMETSYYKVTCAPLCGAAKSRWVTVKVRQTPEDKAEHPPVVTATSQVSTYSEPNKGCQYPESKLTIALGDFIPKSQEQNRGGYNHVIETDANDRPYQMALSASYCYNGPDVQKPRGEPRWFSNQARTQLYENYENGVTIIPGIPTSQTTYYGRCYYKKDQYCDFEMSITIPPKNGREALGVETELAQVETGPAITSDCVYPSSKAVTALLDNLLCEKLALLPGTAQQKIAAVTQALASQGITLAPVTEQMLTLLSEGKCSEVTKLLASQITGNQKVDELGVLVGQENIADLFSGMVDQLAGDELIDSDFISRQIETFDGPIDDPNLRTAAIGVCPDYYFTPVGKRIRIADIGDCVVSINGVLMSFTKNGKTYIPLFKRSTLAFVGYHDKNDFYAHAQPAAGANIRIAQEKDLKLWVTGVEYPAENSEIGRFVAFIEENRAKPGVIANYTAANFNEVKRLMALLPETIFQKIEWSGSVYRFDLLKLKALLQQMLSTTDTQLAILNSILTAPETVCKDQTEVICKVFNCVYNNITGYQDRDILNGRLPLETRKKLLTLLAQNTLTSGTAPGGCAFSSDGEGTVISLLNTTPESDRKPVLEYLVSFPVNALEETPLKRFISKIDGGNFDDLLLIVSDWVSSYYPSKESWQAILQRQDRSKRDLLLLGKNALQTTQSTHSKNGKTTFDFSVQLLGSLPVLKPNINALDYVVVKFAKDFTVGARTYYAGETAKIPAVLCYLIMNDLRNNALATAGKYTAYAVGAAVGVSEIMAATTAAEMTLAIIDMGVLGSDFAMNEVLATRLNQTQEGKAWLDNFNKFVLIYGSTRAVAELAGLTKEMRNYSNKINDPDATAIYLSAWRKSVSFDEFANTVGEFRNGANTVLAQESYRLWQEEKWTELYDLFTTNNLNGKWPPYNGFKSITKTESGDELSGKVFDRFQNRSELTGSFASPVIGNTDGVNELVYTYDSRALADKIEEGTYYIKFRMKSNLPTDLSFDYGEAAPWFNLPGLADQIKSSKNFSELLKNGKVEIIETLKYQDNKWVTIK